MRTFAELRNSIQMYHLRDSELGAEYVAADGGPRIRVFEPAATVDGYVSLHQFAHLWIHRDYVLDAWYVLDVDEPIEIGVDFVLMPRRVGNTLESFTREEDRAPAPARLDELRELIPKLVAAATDPVDEWVAKVVAKRITNPDWNTIFVWGEQRFYVQDLAPSRDELAAWQVLQQA